MPSRPVYSFIVLATLTVAITLCASPRAQDAAAGKPPAVPVVAPVVREVVEYDDYTGRFEAVRRAEIRARVSGYIDRIAFQEGQLVKAGDLLLVIDQRPFTIALKAAQADLEEAIALQELSAMEAERAANLVKRRAISQEEYDDRVQAASASAARVRSRRAAVDRAALDLEFSEVRAPFAGRVGERLIDEGNLVSGETAQATLLTTLVQEDPIYFAFEVSESDFLKYNRLQQSGSRPSSRNTPNAVSVGLIDEDDYPHNGVMDFVANELDPGTGTLRGRAVFANPESFLQSGLFGRLRLQGSGLYTAVMVPDEVVQFDQSRQFVFVVDDQGLAARKWIEPGPIVDGLRVIRSGVTPEDRVIAGAFHRVRAGAPVTPTTSDSAAAK